MIEFLNALNVMSPLAIIGLLATIILMLVKGKTASARKVNEIQTNHLHDLPTMAEDIKEIVTILQRIEVKQSEDFSYIKARLNGRAR
jgi:hypothetical protein